MRLAKALDVHALCSRFPPVTAKALKFALVTMQRSVEVRNMRHGAFKPDENVWQMEMHETKNKIMHRVPLNRYDVATLFRTENV